MAIRISGTTGIDMGNTSVDIQAQVEAGTIPMPTVEEVIEWLPKYE